MAEHNAGLHKKISSIFDGVSMPKKKDDASPPSGAAVAERTDSVPSGPPPSAPQTAPEPKPQQPSGTPAPDPTGGSPSKPLPPAPQTAPEPKAQRSKAKANVIAGLIPWQRIKNKLFAPKPGVDVKKQITIAILVPVLFVVLIIVLIKVLGAPSRWANKPSGAPLANAVAASDNEIEWQIPAPYPTTLRDPMQFRSAGAAYGGTTELIVKSIFYSEDVRSAVIGSQIVHEGDKVLDVTVVKINKDSIKLERNGKRWTQKVRH